MSDRLRRLWLAHWNSMFEMIPILLPADLDGYIGEDQRANIFLYNLSYEETTAGRLKYFATR